MAFCHFADGCPLDIALTHGINDKNRQLMKTRGKNSMFQSSSPTTLKTRVLKLEFSKVPGLEI